MCQHGRLDLLLPLKSSSEKQANDGPSLGQGTRAHRSQCPKSKPGLQGLAKDFLSPPRWEVQVPATTSVILEHADSLRRQPVRVLEKATAPEQPEHTMTT